MIQVYYNSAKILYVQLTNFARITTGMGQTTVTVDFSNYPYKTFLLVGDNGSGKTSFMRCLHPFAYNGGSGDDSSNATLITKGKTGEKRIRIGYHDHVYDIFHLYEWKKDTLSVKSYIQEDGMELNDSGAVTSFKLMVKEKLGLDESFLGLLSLGNSIAGFVEQSSTERKKYAVKIFQELNVFNTYYKNATNAARALKANLSNITTRLEQYRYQQRDDMISESKQLQTKISSLEDTERELLTSIGTLTNQMDANRELLQDYDGLKKRMEELFSDIQLLQTKITTSKDEQVLRNDLHDLEDRLNETKIRIGVIESTMENDLNEKDRLLQSISMLQDNLTRMEQRTDLTELTKLKVRLESELCSLNLNGVDRPPYTTEDLIKSHIYLEELYGMCIDLVTDVNNHDLIPSVLERYLSNPKVAELLTKTHQDWLTKLENTQSAQFSRTVLKKVAMRIIDTTCDTKDKCHYAIFYQDVQDVLHSTVEEVNDNIQYIQDQTKEASDKVTIATIIKKLYRCIETHQKEFDLPIEIFDPKTFILEYMKTQCIYDEIGLTDIIDLSERFDKRDKLEDQLRQTVDQINGLEESRSMCESFQTQLQQSKDRVSDITDRLERNRGNLEYNKKQKSSLEQLVSDTNKEIENVMKLTNLRLEVSLVKQNMSAINGRIVKAQEVSKLLEETSEREKSIRIEIDRARDRYQKLTNILHAIDDLMVEQQDLQERYTQVLWIQQAVNPTKGIPLEIISYHITRRMVNLINPLLDSVYHGKMRILGGDNITLNETDFIIPFMWNDTLIPDISFGSDGQKAIMMLAFSIALLKITTMGDYNIPLLDEMDTTLDDSSRNAFFNLIENYQSEQVFIISHSSLFEGRLVNLIMTSPRNVSNVDESQIIHLYEGGNC